MFIRLDTATKVIHGLHDRLNMISKFVFLLSRVKVNDFADPTCVPHPTDDVWKVFVERVKLLLLS